MSVFSCCSEPSIFLNKHVLNTCIHKHVRLRKYLAERQSEETRSVFERSLVLNIVNESVMNNCKKRLHF